MSFRLMHASILVAFTVAGVLAAGCSSSGGGSSGVAADCESLCEAVNACPDGQQVDCGVCSTTAAKAEAAGCTQQYSAYIACIKALPDNCSFDPPECDSDGTAFAECQAAYDCMQDPSLCSG